MKNKWPVWLLVMVVAIGLIYIWLVLFRSSFNNEPGHLEGEDIWKQSNMFKPVAQNPNQPPKAIDAVTGATPRIIAWHIENVIKQIQPAVVGISVGRTGQAPPWQQGWKILTPSGSWSVGSGAIVHPQGYIITNYHVVASGGNIIISVFNSDGTYKDYPAQVIGADVNKDLALLKINPPKVLPCVPLGNSDMVQVGDQVIAIGNPFGLSQTVTKGIISAKRKKLVIGTKTMYNLFQTDVPINPGNSGGVLCNLHGEVIGINVAIYSPVESVYTGVSFAIPLNQAKTLYGNYMDFSTQPVKYQWLGNKQANYWKPAAFGPPSIPSKFNPANPAHILPGNRIMPSPGEGIEELAWLGIDMTADLGGVETDEIEGISPMEAGLQAGDIIKAVNGIPTPDMYAMKDVIKKIPLKVGQGIVLEIFRPRNNKNIFISFRLKEWDIKGR